MAQPATDAQATVRDLGETQLATLATNAPDRRNDDGEQPKQSKQDDVQPPTQRREEGESGQGGDGTKDVKLVLSPEECLLFSFPKEDATTCPSATLTLSHPDAEAMNSIGFEVRGFCCLQCDYPFHVVDPQLSFDCFENRFPLLMFSFV